MTPCADAMIVADYRVTDIILREHNAYSANKSERMIRITNILFDIKVRWAHIEYCTLPYHKSPNFLSRVEIDVFSKRH